MESTYHGVASVHFLNTRYYWGELEPVQPMDDEYINNAAEEVCYSVSLRNKLFRYIMGPDRFSAFVIFLSV